MNRSAALKRITLQWIVILILVAIISFLVSFIASEIFALKGRTNIVVVNVPEGIPMPSLLPATPKPTTPVPSIPVPEEARNAVTPIKQSEMYTSPIDFNELQSVNPDIIAWLSIPGAEISFPVLQHPTDNGYYLTHDAEQESSSGGAIFIEDYNSSNFRDMCTVIYGHRMYDGTMFGPLEGQYSERESFEQARDIDIYLPKRQGKYLVFAAVPYDNSHILYYNDFEQRKDYEAFIDMVYATDSDKAVLDEAERPQYGDRLLILSTCLWGDRDNRYLIIAKEV